MEKLTINSLFITQHDQRVPIMFYQLGNQPYQVDIHLQLINVTIDQQHTVHIVVTDNQTGRVIFDGQEKLDLSNDGPRPTGYEEVNDSILEISIPFNMEPEDVDGVNRLDFKVTIEGETAMTQLFLAGEVDG